MGQNDKGTEHSNGKWVGGVPNSAGAAETHCSFSLFILQFPLIKCSSSLPNFAPYSNQNPSPEVDFLSPRASIFDFSVIMAKNAAERGSFSAKDYHDPPPAPLIDAVEITKWSFYRALIAEFIATLLFLYVTVLTVIGYKSQTDHTGNKNADACGGVGILGIAWAFGGMIFVLVYCTAGISGSSFSVSSA